jgi:AraC-like DNA-binding protein
MDSRLAARVSPMHLGVAGWHEMHIIRFGEARTRAMDAPTPRVSIARAALVMPLFEHAISAGAPIPQLLENARLPGTFGEEPSAFIPTSSWHTLAGELARVLGKPDLGWQVAIAKPLAAYSHDFTSGIAQAPSLAEAFRFIDRHGRRHCNTHHVQLCVHGAFGYVFHDSCGDRSPGEEQRAAARTASILVVVREFLGPDWRPDLIGIDFDPVALSSDGALDGVRVIRRSNGGFIRVSVEDLAARCRRPIVTATHDTATVGTEFNDRLKQLISTYLGEQVPSLAEIAEILGASPRSLQRRLRTAGTSYSELILNARYEAASELLRYPGVRVVDVACSLGYDDPSHFTRFFRRISGITPQRYRRLWRDGAPVVQLDS